MTRTLITSFCALFLLVACGPKESLLVAGSIDDIYAAEAAGGYGVTSTDPADFGTLKGRVTFKGRAGNRGKIQLGNDKFCDNANPNGMLSESFLFDPSTMGMENVFVYVKSGLSKMKFDVPTEPLEVNQIGCRYVPHMLRLRVGQPLIVKSSDNTMHNVHGLPGANPEYNKVMNTPGSLPPRIYERAEWNAPAKIICDVHGWMSVNLTVLPHPFCAITAKDGSFEFKGLPPGSYKLAIWHEKLKATTVEVTLETKETKELAPIVMTR